jgi:predicted ATP-dependent endonuclease of OLD family
LRSRISIDFLENIQEEAQKRLDFYKLNLEDFNEERENFTSIQKNVINYLESQNLIYIYSYISDNKNQQEEVLLCSFKNIDIGKAETFFKDLSNLIFLAAPSTQVFQFLSEESKKLLFKEQDGSQKYQLSLQAAKSSLKGLFTYDFLAVDTLIEYFKAVRDKDFQEALETGEYGNAYKSLINELNLILNNKKIGLEPDLSGVTFKLDNNGTSTKLYPEDLSHGELKRLSIYMWLKFHNIKNAIVLMDEIEIAFHPDWQYQIISDLKEWEPSNQYILATHSYELCQALTPAHVKELEPKLIYHGKNNKNEP